MNIFLKLLDAHPLPDEVGHDGNEPGHEIEPDHRALEVLEECSDHLAQGMNFGRVDVEAVIWRRRREARAIRKCNK